MKHDRQSAAPSVQNAAPSVKNAGPSAENTGSPAAAPTRGGASVQLKKALNTSTYDEGRKLVSPDGGGDQNDGEKQEKATVILSARKGGSPFSREFWTDLDVGHCWVDVIKPDGRKDSWGYTANSVSSFPRYQPWKTVDGRVLHPDGSRGASGTLATEVDAEQLERGEKWGAAAGGKYNLFGFNGGHSCATFAKGFYEEATGDSAPTGMFGALIANPNDLSTAMNKKLEKERAEKPEEAEREEQNAGD